MPTHVRQAQMGSNWRALLLAYVRPEVFRACALRHGRQELRMMEQHSCACGCYETAFSSAGLELQYALVRDACMCHVVVEQACMLV